jgi:hypothetical protein
VLAEMKKNKGARGGAIRTIIGKANGTDRTAVNRRRRLDTEGTPVRDLAERRSRDALPRRATAHLKAATTC